MFEYDMRPLFGCLFLAGVLFGAGLVVLVLIIGRWI